jgi:hypothetical protein
MPPAALPGAKLLLDFKRGFDKQVFMGNFEFSMNQRRM